jgi:hypothetical protein
MSKTFDEAYAALRVGDQNSREALAMRLIDLATWSGVVNVAALRDRLILLEFQGRVARRPFAF